MSSMKQRHLHSLPLMCFDWSIVDDRCPTDEIDDLRRGAISTLPRMQGMLPFGGIAGRKSH
jgi:hypothetical protein